MALLSIDARLHRKQRTSQAVNVPLDELELAAKAVYVARRTLDAEAAAWATHIQKRRNQQTSIGRLPIELTAKVILSFFRQNNRSNLKRMQELASVCTIWWQTILSFPAFWTTFDSSAPQSIALKVKRSGHLPLSICIRKPDPFAGFNPSPLSAIDPNRLKSLKCLGKALEGLTPILWKLSRQLVTLDLGQRSSFTPLQVRISSKENLRHVKLRSVIVAWAAFRNLMALSITHLSQHNAPSPMQLRRICMACPPLEELELSRISNGEEVTLPDANQKPIALSRLRRVDLIRVPMQVSLLVQAERLEVFKLRENPQSLSEASASACKTYDTFVAPIFRNSPINRATAMIDRDMLSFTAYKKDGPVALQVILDESNLNLLESAIHIIPSAVEELVVRLHFHTREESRFRDATTASFLLPVATDVSLKANCTTTLGIILLLTVPQEPDDDEGITRSTDIHWLAPKLAKLRLDMYGFKNEKVQEVESGVGDMMRARSSGEGKWTSPHRGGRSV